MRDEFRHKAGLDRFITVLGSAVNLDVRHGLYSSAGERTNSYAYMEQLYSIQHLRMTRDTSTRASSAFVCMFESMYIPHTVPSLACVECSTIHDYP